MKQSADNNKATAVKKQSRRKYIKPIVITAVILAVVIAAVIIVPKLLNKDTSSTRVVTYNVSEVTYGNISQTVSGSGTVTPVTSETVTSSKGGEVEKVNFTVGEEVKENDVIAVVNGESIKAPCDGILIEQPLSVGDEVAQGGSVAIVMGKDGFTMGIAVDETEISSIKLDQDVTFTVDAVSGSFTGKVTDEDSSVTAEEVEELTAYPSIDSVAPVITSNETVKKNSNRGNYSIVGVTPSYFSVMDTDIQRSRKLAESDNEWSTKVCVIGTEVATDLFGTWDAVDGTVIIGDSVYKVVGVLEEQGSSMSGSDDKKVLIPYSTASKLTGQKSVSSFYIKAYNEDSVDTAISIVESFLLQITRDEDAYDE